VFLIQNGLKRGDALTPPLLNFGLEYNLSKAQMNEEGLTLSGAHRLLACAGDVNLLSEDTNKV
jgi:hypothetical protein